MCLFLYSFSCMFSFTDLTRHLLSIWTLGYPLCANFEKFQTILPQNFLKLYSLFFTFKTLIAHVIASLIMIHHFWKSFNFLKKSLCFVQCCFCLGDYIDASLSSLLFFLCCPIYFRSHLIVFFIYFSLLRFLFIFFYTFQIFPEIPNLIHI